MTARPHSRHSRQPGTARLGSVRFSSAPLGTARLGTARHGTARHGSARLGTARLGSARHGSAQLGSARRSPAQPGSPQLTALGRGVGPLRAWPFPRGGAFLAVCGAGAALLGLILQLGGGGGEGRSVAVARGGGTVGEQWQQQAKLRNFMEVTNNINIQFLEVQKHGLRCAP